MSFVPAPITLKFGKKDKYVKHSHGTIGQSEVFLLPPGDQDSLQVLWEGFCVQIMLWAPYLKGEQHVLSEY